jgi:hypothetical protein
MFGDFKITGKISIERSKNLLFQPERNERGTEKNTSKSCYVFSTTVQV